MVSFLLPREQRTRLSFLDLRDEDDVEDVEDEDDVEEVERVEVAEGVGLGGSLLWGEPGGEVVFWGWFSSVSSIWTMAEAVEERRLELTSVAADGASLCMTDMALRRQLSHCCLWKMSLTCSVWDWPWDGSWNRTRKMFLAEGGQRYKEQYYNKGLQVGLFRLINKQTKMT